MAENISNVIFTLFLFYSAWEDGRSKTISTWLLVFFGIIGIVIACFLHRKIDRICLSCLIGLFIVGISHLTKGAIGEGDGWFFTVSGLFLDGIVNVKLLVYGIFLSGVVSAVVYIVFRLRGNDVRKKTLPFLPFLLPVWIMMVMV